MHTSFSINGKDCSVAKVEDGSPILTVSDGSYPSSVMFEIDGNGIPHFNKNFDIKKCADLIRDAFITMAGSFGDYSPFYISDKRSELIVSSGARGYIQFGRNFKNQVARSLFRQVAYVVDPKCVCGADKCGSPVHSDWCDKN